MPTDSVRMACATSSPSSKMRPPSNTTGRQPAHCATAASSFQSICCLCANNAVSRYSAPESRYAQPSSAATRAATVPLPDADGPSIAITFCIFRSVLLENKATILSLVGCRLLFDCRKSSLHTSNQLNFNHFRNMPAAWRFYIRRTPNPYSTHAEID